jgi:hypothetical protein
MTQIPVDTAALKALDIPTRWLLATALDEARQHATATLTAAEKGQIRLGEGDEADLRRKREVYLEIARAIRD